MVEKPLVGARSSRPRTPHSDCHCFSVVACTPTQVPSSVSKAPLGTIAADVAAEERRLLARREVLADASRPARPLPARHHVEVDALAACRSSRARSSAMRIAIVA